MLPEAIGATRAVPVVSEYNTKLSLVLRVPAVIVNTFLTVTLDEALIDAPEVLFSSRELTLPIPEIA